MNVGFVKKSNLSDYLNNWGTQYDGDRFAGTIIAITYDSNSGEYTVISR